MRLPFMKQKFDDDQIVLCAQSALEVETTLNASDVNIESDKGVVTLIGKVRSRIDKNRAAIAVQQSLIGAQLKYDRIIDDIVVA